MEPRTFISVSISISIMSRDSSVGIATGYGLADRAWLWGPPSVLSNGYRGFFLWE